MNKKNIRIMFDIWAGPIWGCYYDEDKKEYDFYIKSICNDKELMKLHQELQDYILHITILIIKEKPVILIRNKKRKINIKCLIY